MVVVVERKIMIIKQILHKLSMHFYCKVYTYVDDNYNETLYKCKLCDKIKVDSNNKKNGW